MDADLVPPKLREYADQAVQYIKNAVGIAPLYDSDTLPLVDHYLGTVGEQPETLNLMIQLVGAYFGETVRRNLGGRWDGGSGEQEDWRIVLPTGVTFSPTGVVAAAIAKSELDDFDSELDAPARMKPFVQEALARMGEVPIDQYFSLCNRLDTLEHVHEVLVAHAAQMLGDSADAEGEDGVEAVADEPSGPIN